MHLIIRPNTTPTDITDRGFTGHKHNDYIKLIYMGARWYLPGIGRFISADTIVPYPTNPQSYNRYSYAQNSPINRIDPSGHGDIGCPEANGVCDNDEPIDDLIDNSDDTYIGPDSGLGDSPSPLDMPPGLIFEIETYLEDEDINTYAEAVMAYLADRDKNELDHNTLLQLATIFLGDGDFYFDTLNSDLRERIFVSVNPIDGNGTFAKVVFNTDGVFFELVSDTYSVGETIRREQYESVFVPKSNNAAPLVPPWPAANINLSDTNNQAVNVDNAEFYTAKWYPWWDYFNWPDHWGDRPQPVY